MFSIASETGMYAMLYILPIDFNLLKKKWIVNSYNLHKKYILR